MRWNIGLRNSVFNLQFVPENKPIGQLDLTRLQQFVTSAKKLLVLTGAGLSTESGIPDYRSAKVGLYERTDRRPIQYQQFLKSEKARQRYWARNFVGWPQFAAFEPNAAHHALSRWEESGKVSWLVTQNVDALHTKAGSRRVTELHGCSHRVVCLSCPSTMSRWHLQSVFESLNPEWKAETLGVQLAPDGDVLLSDEQVASFKVPECPSCGGILKPDVVFFGDNVPSQVKDHVFEQVSECDRILVAGSSLHVYSGYRYVKRAYDLGKKIAIVNIGETRADSLAHVICRVRCGEFLPLLHVPS